MKKLFFIIFLIFSYYSNHSFASDISCDSDSIDLPKKIKTVLMKTGMTQCVMPFGVLIAADKEMNKEYD